MEEISAVRRWRIALWRVFFLSDDSLHRQVHSELRQRRDQDQSPCLHIQSLVYDLLTRRDLAHQERPPGSTTVPNLAFDLLTRRDLFY